MTTRVINRRSNKPYDVYIGRPSKWGNPYTHLPLASTIAAYKVATREEAIAKYRVWLMTQPHLLAEISSLRGRVLGCWCKPASCHGDILAELADETDVLTTE